ncbi:RHO1 GDP-GTP exchange protein 2 [Quaeritorhiza haematococci]|nr:RHO1 GDP-GTP exchange protein 2 [Quaeritorhiza haematococci]
MDQYSGGQPVYSQPTYAANPQGYRPTVIYQQQAQPGNPAAGIPFPPQGGYPYANVNGGYPAQQQPIPVPVPVPIGVPVAGGHPHPAGVQIYAQPHPPPRGTLMRPPFQSSPQPPGGFVYQSTQYTQQVAYAQQSMQGTLPHPGQRPMYGAPQRPGGPVIPPRGLSYGHGHQHQQQTLPPQQQQHHQQRMSPPAPPHIVRHPSPAPIAKDSSPHATAGRNTSPSSSSSTMSDSTTITSNTTVNRPQQPTAIPVVLTQSPSAATGEVSMVVSGGAAIGSGMGMNGGPAPMVYPALLSQVANAFRSRIALSSHTKDGLEYNDSFVGREAVDTIAFIIKTTDRNLALLLGRALDAQKFFHDVTWNHRLRDSINEFYQFQSTPMFRGIAGPGGANTTSIGASVVGGDDARTASRAGASSKPDDLPNGVFTLLTDCYSPTCTRDRLCYSIACPRRLEQQTRLQQQMSSMLQRSPSRSSFAADEDFKDKLWSTTVSKEISDSVSDDERKRQEAIFEIVQSEREFVADLELVQRLYLEPLRTSKIIPEQRRDAFCRKIFINIPTLIAINTTLLRRLASRQKENAIVEKIGDIFASIASDELLNAYVEYGANQAFARTALSDEKKNNSDFRKFVEEQERKPESRKLVVESFLGRPTTRLARYPLLLEAVLKKTPEGHPDQTYIPQAVAFIRTILQKINLEAGKADNLIKLQSLASQIVFDPKEPQDLRLNEEGRQFVRDGSLILKRAGGDIELHLFLFDHCLLMTKKKKNNVFKAHKKAIPLELLVLPSERVPGAPGSSNTRRASAIFSSATNVTSKSSSSNLGLLVGGGTDSSGSGFGSTLGAGLASSTMGAGGLAGANGGDFAKFQLSFTHLGRSGGQYTLHCSTHADRRAWREAIEKQKRALTERKRKFEIVTMLDSYFPSTVKVNCSTSVGGRLVLGTDSGLYVGPTEASEGGGGGAGSGKFRRVIDLERIVQVEVLPDHETLLVLAGNVLVRGI